MINSGIAPIGFEPWKPIALIQTGCLCYRSDIRGLILPALGLSDWKHDGVVELYRSAYATAQGQPMLQHKVSLCYSTRSAYATAQGQPMPQRKVSTFYSTRLALGPLVVSSGPRRPAQDKFGQPAHGQICQLAHDQICQLGLGQLGQPAID
jgi:hypothetical protein